MHGHYLSYIPVSLVTCVLGAQTRTHPSDLSPLSLIQFKHSLPPSPPDNTMLRGRVTNFPRIYRLETLSHSSHGPRIREQFWNGSSSDPLLRLGSGLRLRLWSPEGWMRATGAASKEIPAHGLRQETSGPQHPDSPQGCWGNLTPWRLAPGGEQVGRERPEETWMPFKTVLEATCHILFIRSKSPSPAHAQGLWTFAKPSLTLTSLPGRL